ncbi:hypothetical protein [Paraliomyxa miuraensis]|uniref:hypothetical protein n=1 Tax=Paraliomyxa miuraensis TaxID=376150 RepID=UPI00225AF28F|nr:hypothetical protein [Paraliomyxa miuraensis]MCX4245712.1 hypothetical protein [Paraliomyxa miuraensis]
MVRGFVLLASLASILGALACAKPDSVALGGACKQQVECKDPADTCMTLGTESLCTLACSAEAACPDGYACARMDVRVEGEDGGGKAGAQGYCLAESRVGSHVATIAPKGDGSGKGGKGKKAKGKKAKDR